MLRLPVFALIRQKRNAEEDIAEMYADFNFDVLMGGGDEFFNPEKREDKKDIYKKYKQKGYQIVKDKSGLSKLDNNQPLLGVFTSGALPYSIDQKNTANLSNMPSLAEMTKAAIHQMKDNKEGFVLQIEAGKVDWAAHANDIAGLYTIRFLLMML